MSLLLSLLKKIRRVIKKKSRKLNRLVSRFNRRGKRWKKTLATDRGARLILEELIDWFLAEEPAPLFRNIEIETVNRCNGNCSFCPVGKDADPRPYCKMSMEQFKSIIHQLGELKYDGSIALYSNNEPLLDARIYDFAAMARAGVPNAQVILFTNGTLLTVETFQKLIPHLDQLVIDDYTTEGRFHDPVQEVKKYWEANQVPGKEVVFWLRRPDVILSSRGGTAPNRTVIPSVHSSCLLPFCQMIVRPDGKLSLCCNDPLGRYTLGDLTTQSLVDAWRGTEYQRVREKIRQGRSQFQSCSACDAFLGVTHDELAKLPTYHGLCTPWESGTAGPITEI